MRSWRRWANLLPQRWGVHTGVPPHLMWGPPTTKSAMMADHMVTLQRGGTFPRCRWIRQMDVFRTVGVHRLGFAVSQVR